MNDDVASGVVYQGVIHLFRDGVADRDSVVRTLFHELLHFCICFIEHFVLIANLQVVTTY